MAYQKKQYRNGTARGGGNVPRKNAVRRYAGSDTKPSSYGVWPYKARA